ncbi:MAG: hypothetical protein AAGA90_07885 [Actinomycetota bacterium]
MAIADRIDSALEQLPAPPPPAPGTVPAEVAESEQAKALSRIFGEAFAERLGNHAANAVAAGAVGVPVVAIVLWRIYQTVIGGL